MLMQMTAMAVGESAIEVKYNGKKSFATIVIDANGGAGESPLVSLGVSDTSLAQAVTNVVVAFTGLTTSTLDDLVNTINNFLGGTVDADTEITAGDFKCRIRDGYQSLSIHHATVSAFVDEAGTAQNLKGYKDATTGDSWFGTLVRDNDADGVGCIMKRVPPPHVSQASVAVRQITGISTQSGGTAVTNGVTRTIHDTQGNILWSVSLAAPTSANMAFDLLEPVVFNGPVVIKDECLNLATNYADMDATSTLIVWALPPNAK